MRRGLRRAMYGPVRRARDAAGADTLCVVAALGVLNVVRHVAPSSSAWVGGTASALLLGHARRRGLTWTQLGLGREHLPRGAAWAAGAAGAVGSVYLVGVLTPATRPAFVDTRYQVPLPEALSMAFVTIPVGTVLLEEVAFRSVLWGLLARRGGTPVALGVSSALFGLWHVLPSLRFDAGRSGTPDPATSPPTSPPTARPSRAGARRTSRGSQAAAGPTASTASTTSTARLPGERARVVLGTVAFTALGGLVMGELRRRTNSTVAAAGLHWATNALGVLFGLAANRLATRSARAARPAAT